jgi:hypothetical protein
MTASWMRCMKDRCQGQELTRAIVQFTEDMLSTVMLYGGCNVVATC